ncbi:MAG: permease prefix domain 1-containing protein [Oscillospiraceae bacterium]|nr:permease prefix domain 1-containing protein [Oscillospiraceae bacterium]
MNMKEKIFVDRLFAEYENTQEIIDFKEEITINLQERIKEFMSKGMNEDEAFEKTTAELGDITQIADNIGKQKKHEAISQMYMATRPPIKKWQAAWFSICGGLSLFALVISTLMFFFYKPSYLFLIPLLILPFTGGIFTYLGLTVETRSNYPMAKKRASIYGVGAFIILIDIWQFFFTYFSYSQIIPSIMFSVTILLPVLMVLPYMILTEKNRKKPWVLKEMEHWQEFYKVDPKNAIKFGLISGAVGFSAVILFIVLGVLIGFQYSWIVFVILMPIEMILTTILFKK